MKRSKVVISVIAVSVAAAAVWLLGVDKPLFSQGQGGTMPVLYGNVEIRQVDLAFRVSGRVTAIKFEEGDRVKVGDVIATLDPSLYQDEVEMAKAEVAAQEANLRKLRAGNRPEEIARVRADVAERKAVLVNARRLLKRQKALRKSNTVSAQAYDDALAAETKARAQLVSARKNLDLMLAGTRVEDIDQAAAQLARAQASLRLAEIHLSDTVLRAPEAGTVLTRVGEPGAMVNAGTPICTLSLRNPVRIRAFIDEKDLGRIKPGMKALIHSDSFPDKTYPAQVGYISPTAEFTPKTVETPNLRSALVYRIRLIAQDPEDELRQGMPVTVTFPAEAGGRAEP